MRQRGSGVPHQQTPALHAHWLEIQDRLARVAAEQLALQAGTEPTDPQS